MKMKCRTREAFTRTELLVTVAAGIVLAIWAAGFILPSLAGSSRSPRIACVNNLKQVGIGFRLYANDNDGKYPGQMPEGMAITNQEQTFRYYEMVLSEIGSPKVLICPEDWPDRTAVTQSNNPTSRLFSNRHLSYFVGLEADETKPGMLLAGDRNLTSNGVPVQGGQSLTTKVKWGWNPNQLHKNGGNVALADGSVQQRTSAELQAKLPLTGDATNLLSIP